MPLGGSVIKINIKVYNLNATKADKLYVTVSCLYFLIIFIKFLKYEAFIR